MLILIIIIVYQFFVVRCTLQSDYCTLFCIIFYLRDYTSIPKMPPISNVWKHFTKVSSNLSMCNICRKRLKTSGNTSNLRSHLKTHNKSIPQGKDTQDEDDPINVSTC